MAEDYSSFKLNDKIAIVTGASQGIGKAIALGLAQAGAHVVLAKHPEGRKDEINAVQAEIQALGRKARSSPSTWPTSSRSARWSHKPKRCSADSTSW